MKKATLGISLSLIFIVLFGFSSTAQISRSVTPISFKTDFVQPDLRPNHHALDLKKVKQEDAQFIESVRFAAPLIVSYQPAQSGTWTTLENGDRLWQLHLSAKEALGIFVVYENFSLPKGAMLFMYSPDRQQVLGAFTAKNNKQHGKFMTGMIDGTDAILEYYEPTFAKGQNPFKISKLYIAYNTDHIQAPKSEFKTYGGFGDAMSCNVNVNCSTGNNWQEQKKGMARMLRTFEEGIGWCSGSLINNSKEDGTPYILSAYHCIAGYTPDLALWRFDFNYESEDCNTPSEEPNYQSLLGCNYRVGHANSDVLLLELEDEIPLHYEVVFNGWNRIMGFVPSTSTAIHHPRGDIKKISVDQDFAKIYSNSIFWSNGYVTPANHHFKIDFDIGTIEDGSSGSPLFDESGKIVGQLHGGNANCNTEVYVAYYGRFSMSWNGGGTPETRLKDWLDPLNSGQVLLESFVRPYVNISGTLSMPSGEKIAAVKVYLSGTSTDSTYTDYDGNYKFSFLQKGGNYHLLFSKNTLPLNGVSLFDMLLIQKHVLGLQTFSDPYQIMAADVNNSGMITAFDMIHLRKVMLATTDQFPNQESWLFLDKDFYMENLTTDFHQNTIGVKTGDVNFTADPKE